MTGLYRFAELNIEIRSLHEQIHTRCADYRVSGDAADPACAPAFSVETTQTDIDAERVLAVQIREAKGLPEQRFPDAYLETVAVHRKISEKMPYYGVFLAHGSTVAVDGAAYLFAALSGTGKSTHTRLWRELLGERAVMVNDDKPFLRVTESGETVAYGTPWDGKHHLSRNIAVPLRAVCLLERGEENRIEEIGKAEALPRLLILQFYRPDDPVALSRTLTLIDRMNPRFYRLHCNMDRSAAELAYNTMKGGRTP